MKPKLLLCLALVSLTALPTFAASGLFPKMPPATNAYFVNTRKDSENARMTAWALQGLINQSSAAVYVLSRPFDLEQLKDCGKPYKKLPRLKGADGGLRALFQKYQKRVKKMFIYDPNKDWTWYLALMSGAQQEGIPVTEKIKNELISEFSWKGGVEDFRNRWTNRIDAYNWALVHLMPNCTKKVVFALKKDMPLDDYAVASKGFVFWLNFKKPDEVAEIKKIFSTPEYGVGTSLMGYASDGDAANYVSNPFGIGYVVSDYYSNGSFWSSFPDKTYKQSPGKAVKAEPGKIYVSINWSDGDNLQFDQNPLYRFWHDPARGTIPVATQLAPALQGFNSPLLDWYYSHMTTNDELMAGATGIQFIFVQYYNRALFPAWCDLTRVWCHDAGFHTGRICLAADGSVRYITYMKKCGFDGVLGDWQDLRPEFHPLIVKPGVSNKEDLFNQLMAIVPNPHEPKFISFEAIVPGFWQGGHGFSAIKQVIERVEAAHPGRYVFLLPKDQFATVRAYYEVHKPRLIGIGLPLTDEGLVAVTNSDGKFTVVNREGRRCWLVPKTASPNYFYVKMDSTFRPEPGKTLEIDLAYFDSGSGDIALNYDSTDAGLPSGGAYKPYPYAIHRMNSGKWKLARFYLKDARFEHRENGGADFRFCNSGDNLLISAVELQRESGTDAGFFEKYGPGFSN